MSRFPKSPMSDKIKRCKHCNNKYLKKMNENGFCSIFCKQDGERYLKGRITRWASDKTWERIPKGTPVVIHKDGEFEAIEPPMFFDRLTPVLTDAPTDTGFMKFTIEKNKFSPEPKTPSTPNAN